MGLACACCCASAVATRRTAASRAASCSAAARAARRAASTCAAWPARTLASCSPLMPFQWSRRTLGRRSHMFSHTVLDKTLDTLYIYMGHVHLTMLGMARCCNLRGLAGAHIRQQLAFHALPVLALQRPAL